MEKRLLVFSILLLLYAQAMEKEETDIKECLDRYFHENSEPYIVSQLSLYTILQPDPDAHPYQVQQLLFTQEYYLNDSELSLLCTTHDKEPTQSYPLKRILQHKKLQKKLIKDLIKAKADWYTINSALLVFYAYCDNLFRLLTDSFSIKHELKRVTARLTYHVAYSYYNRNSPEMAQRILNAYMKERILMIECHDIYQDINKLLEKCEYVINQQKS